MQLYGLDRLTLFLLLALAALLAARQLAETEAPPLTSLDARQIQEIRILEGKHLQLALLRDAEGWLLTHPEIRRARPERVAQLLALLRAPSRASWAASQDLQRQAGLQQPLRTIDFGKTRIAFGGTSMPSGERYVLADGRIHLIDAFWFDLTGLPARHFEVP